MANNTNSVEVSATAKYVRMAPRKTRMVIDMIRNLPVAKALEVLQFSTRAAAEPVSKVLRSAIANAVNNNGLRADDLYVKLAYVDEGPTLKRIRPRAKGSASRINKRMSHITVVVAPRKDGAWHEALKQYLDENFAFVKAFLARELPEAVMYIPEATYLAWVDLSRCLPDVADLPDFFANKAGVLLEGGDSLFVGNAKGYVRLNLAMPRAIIQTGLERMRDAIRKERTEH
mgnify:CR=1 FL=1